ncbi:hypothetical protein H4Q26_018081 [Puccinia striiformis f. sp. tritici PST-130]|nr:hypothetical protein H4Q26_018081 [Puccinia striiformis f. sp. tritici PST-130]
MKNRWLVFLFITTWEIRTGWSVKSIDLFPTSQIEDHESLRWKSHEMTPDHPTEPASPVRLDLSLSPSSSRSAFSAYSRESQPFFIPIFSAHHGNLNPITELDLMPGNPQPDPVLLRSSITTSPQREIDFLGECSIRASVGSELGFRSSSRTVQQETKVTSQVTGAMHGWGFPVMKATTAILFDLGLALDDSRAAQKSTQSNFDQGPERTAMSGRTYLPRETKQTNPATALNLQIQLDLSSSGVATKKRKITSSEPEAETEHNTLFRFWKPDRSTRLGGLGILQQNQPISPPVHRKESPEIRSETTAPLENDAPPTESSSLAAAVPSSSPEPQPRLKRTGQQFLARARTPPAKKVSAIKAKQKAGIENLSKKRKYKLVNQEPKDTTDTTSNSRKGKDDFNREGGPVEGVSGQKRERTTQTIGKEKENASNFAEFLVVIHLRLLQSWATKSSKVYIEEHESLEEWLLELLRKGPDHQAWILFMKIQTPLIDTPKEFIEAMELLPWKEKLGKIDEKTLRSVRGEREVIKADQLAITLAQDRYKPSLNPSLSPSLKSYVSNEDRLDRVEELVRLVWVLNSRLVEASGIILLTLNTSKNRISCKMNYLEYLINLRTKKRCIDHHRR